MPWKVKYGFEYYDPPTLKMIVPYLKQMCSLCTLAGGAAHFCQRRLFLPVIGKKKKKKKKEGSVATLRMTDWLSACNKKKRKKKLLLHFEFKLGYSCLKKKKQLPEQKGSVTATHVFSSCLFILISSENLANIPAHDSVLSLDGRSLFCTPHHFHYMTP